MVLAASKLDLNNKLDNDLFNHIVYVSNQSLMIAKKEGIDNESLEKIGKMLWRLFMVVQAYNAKRRNASLEEVIRIVGDFRSVFSGG